MEVYIFDKSVADALRTLNSAVVMELPAATFAEGVTAEDEQAGHM